MFFEDNDFILDEFEINEHGEYTEDILEEFEFDNKISIINFYKKQLSNDSDFIGIKNLSDFNFLSIVQDTNSNSKLKSRVLKRKEHIITLEQYTIFQYLFNDLNIVCNYIKLQNIVNKIINLIYV